MNSQKVAHLAYRCAVFFKGFDGLLEVCSGVALLCITNPGIRHLVQLVTRGELIEDPEDFVATHLVRASQHFSTHTQHFAGIYLLGHGLVKVGLVVGLLRKVTWSYPAAIAALALFIAYQVYRIFSNPSLTLSVLTAIDAIVIYFIWHEWNQVRTRKQ